MGVHIADVSHFVRQVRAQQTLLVNHAARQGVAQGIHNRVEAASPFSSPAVCLDPSCLPISFPHQLPIFPRQPPYGR